MIQEIIIAFCVLFLLCTLLLKPVHYAKVFTSGLSLFATSVLPGLFPFMFLTRILSSLGFIKHISTKCSPLMQRVFNSPGIGMYTLIISMLSGYPVGAKIIGDLHTGGSISDNDAKKMLCYSMTSGPVFMIGTVGSILLKNLMAGIVIMVSHILSNILSGIILCNILKKKESLSNHNQNKIAYATTNTNIDKILSDSMFSSVQSILIVGGFISFFYCFTQVLFDLNIFELLGFPLLKFFEVLGLNPQIFRGVMSGIVEVTRGVKELSPLFSSNPTLITSLCSMLVSFSGLSIILQSKAMISGLNIKTRFLILSKSVHAIISLVLCFAISSLVLI